MALLSPGMRILVVDDDPGHCELVTRNLRRAGIANGFTVIHSGDEALDYVFRRGLHADRPGNGEFLILLDINMPGAASGLDVLRAVKADPATRKIPVIMLTTTDDPREIERCYALGCNVYITKPVESGKFMEAVKRLGLLISVASLPHEEAMADEPA